MTILDFIKDNWLIIAPVVWEILVRVIPTKWNLSIIDYVMGIINVIIVNKRIPQPDDVVASNDKQSKLVQVKRTRWR